MFVVLFDLRLLMLIVTDGSVKALMLGDESAESIVNPTDSKSNLTHFDSWQHCPMFGDCDRLTVWRKAGEGAAEAILAS